jgi:hypothetical protein
MAEKKETQEVFNYDFTTGALTDAAGNAVDPNTFKPMPKATVSDVRTKRLLKVALSQHYR